MALLSMEQVFTSRLRSALEPSLTPREWKSEDEISLTESVNHARISVPILKIEFELCTGFGAAIRALDQFENQTWLNARRMVMAERMAARNREQAIMKIAKKLTAEKILALRQKMREYCNAMQKVMALGAAGLRARIVRWSENMARIVSNLPGIAASRVLVAKWRGQADKAWLELREQFLSLED